ncbi:hypothetical protein E4U26_000237, partial [Claviceps purpurea]
MDSRPHNRAADVRAFCGTGPRGFAHAPEAPTLYQQPALHSALHSALHKQPRGNHHPSRPTL